MIPRAVSHPLGALCSLKTPLAARVGATASRTLVTPASLLSSRPANDQHQHRPKHGLAVSRVAFPEDTTNSSQLLRIILTTGTLAGLWLITRKTLSNASDFSGTHPNEICQPCPWCANRHIIRRVHCREWT